MQKIKICFKEDVDSMGPGDFNELTLETEDGGAGAYFVLKTDRWAFDELQDFTKLLKSIEICRDYMEFTETEPVIESITNPPISDADTKQFSIVEKCRAYVAKVRGYEDVPGFDACVQAEIDKRFNELLVILNEIIPVLVTHHYKNESWHISLCARAKAAIAKVRSE